MWFRNTYCLVFHKPKYCIFSVPNDGKDIKEQLRKKATGLLPGVSDLIVVLENKVLFVEVKDDKGIQSKNQIIFQTTVNNLGHYYYLVRSIDEFKNMIYEHTK